MIPVTVIIRLSFQPGRCPLELETEEGNSLKAVLQAVWEDAHFVRGLYRMDKIFVGRQLDSPNEIVLLLCKYAMPRP